ncbi:hypothetical protein [Alteromonas antoniana]|uniref:hypothetical protein n=1 Tax=Alteromonas antoniana TaxID=2803813 RepID=UPI001C4848B8|nr:hypothetical protein [Alteromonas antoniana]
MLKKPLRYLQSLNNRVYLYMLLASATCILLLKDIGNDNISLMHAKTVSEFKSLPEPNVPLKSFAGVSTSNGRQVVVTYTFLPENRVRKVVDMGNVVWEALGKYHFEGSVMYIELLDGEGLFYDVGRPVEFDNNMMVFKGDGALKHYYTEDS